MLSFNYPSNMPQGVVNGSSIKAARRSAMITAFAQGESVASVARRFRCDRATATAVQRSEFVTVQQRKERIAAQAERIATLACNGVLDDLYAGKITGVARATVGGIYIDKLLALRGDANTFNVNHTHTHRLSDDDILAFAVQRSKPRAIRATVIEETNGETLALPEKTDQDSERVTVKNDAPRRARTAGKRPRPRKMSAISRKNSKTGRP